jgi:hypothetical protein
MATLDITPSLPGEYVELPAGRYVLRVFRPVDDPGPLGITMSQ